MSSIDLDGLVLQYTDRPADPAAPSGPDLLLLHGYGVSGAVWEPLLPFIEPGHRVVTFDARNHGGSGTTRTSSVADNVADIVGLIARLGLERPVLVGSSIGALFATEVAARHPASISAAVLVGGLAHAAVADPAIGAANTALINGYVTDLIGTASRSVPQWFGPCVGPRVHGWAEDMVRALRVPDLGLAAELATYDPRPYLPAVTVPLHYVHGQLDPIPLAVVEEAAALSPHPSVQVVPHAAHMPHVELPGRFADVLAGLVRTAG